MPKQMATALYQASNRAGLFLFRRRVWDENPAWLEWLLATMAMAIGLFVLLPFHTTFPPFYLLGRIFGEWAWGLLWVLAGYGQAKMINVPDHAWGKVGAAITGFVMWSFLAGFTLSNEWRIAAWVSYGLFAVGWFLILMKQPLEVHFVVIRDILSVVRWPGRVWARYQDAISGRGV